MRVGIEQPSHRRRIERRDVQDVAGLYEIREPPAVRKECGPAAARCGNLLARRDGCGLSTRGRHAEQTVGPGEHDDAVVAPRTSEIRANLAQRLGCSAAHIDLLE